MKITTIAIYNNKEYSAGIRDDGTIVLRSDDLTKRHYKT